MSLLIVLAAIFSALVQNNHQKAILEKSIQTHINSIKAKVFRDINDQFEALTRMANRCEVDGEPEEFAWRQDAKNYIHDIEGIDTLLFVNPDQSIKWLEHRDSTVFFEGMSLKDELDLSERLYQAEASNLLELSEPVQSLGGEFVVYLVKTISNGTNPQGSLVARVNTHDFFNKVLIEPQSSGFFTQVVVDAKQLYHNNPMEQIDPINKNFEINLDSDPEGILITVYPTEATKQTYLNLLPELIVISGFLISFLFYWAMVSRLKSRKQASELATEIKQKQFIQKKLEHMAHFDALTNLPNRYLMSLELDKKISSQTPVWLFYLDLDFFKDVNDTLGHSAGDQLLVEISRRFEKIKEAGEMVARIGGDEFVIIVDGLQSEHEIKSKLKQVLQAIDQPFYFDEDLIKINGSIGVAHYPQHCDTTTELITHADTALRYIKGHGRHNYKIYDVDLAKSSQDRLVLLNKIKNGIKKNEFELVYQARVDVKTGKFWGAEALIRWSQKDGSLLTPKVFLQILEDTGLIVSVGWQVLEIALDRFNQLLTYNPDLKLSYNISAKQLESPNFVEDLIHMLNKKGFPKSHFELELTEQTLISDLGYSKNILNQVKSHGISIAIDDFGTGYSSLSYLKNFPVDVIKIDKSFVKDIAIQKDDYELINAIISMGRNLKVKVVAEGIESQDQLNILSRLGCDEAQGYYFNKPAPYEVFKEVVAAEVAM